MTVMTAVGATHRAGRGQVELHDAARNVQAGLALHADRLQRVRIGGTANQEVAAEADANRRIGANAAVAAGQRAARHAGGRSERRPLHGGVVGEAEIEAEAADVGDITFGAAAGTLEYAVQGRIRTDDEADVLASAALEHANLHAAGLLRVCGRNRSREAMADR